MYYGGMVRPLGLAVVAMLAGACTPGTSPTPTTGLTGTVVRGPVTPVCMVGVPCSAPFSAGFSVEGSKTVVGRFRSDADGRFTVMLAPGMYRVVPDPDAPIIAPASQAKSVTVGNTGLTSVTLEFDTGIR